ncbi:MAG: hypothetical protein V2I56_13060 [Desulfobacteraceae bacterium]|nr:hypothetical protein [Desulfobacteraceae bacterium]
MSDFHEMVSNLRMRKERALHGQGPGHGIDHGGRRLGIERRQFTYSHYFPERREGDERRSMPERRVETNADANG